MSPSFSRLAGVRVLFGHQSVGTNIVSGVGELLALEPAAPWRVLELADSASAIGGFLVHAAVGRNGDPISKTREFCDLAAGDLGGRLHLALHKYCYADIEASTDVAGLFARYRDSMAALAHRRPELTLVHMTVPLVRVRTGAGAWIRRALGRTSPRAADNARREQFNDLLRGEYEGRMPVFDLAALESGPGLARSLKPDFTDDGGHLNDAGRRYVADRFIDFLAGCADERRGARARLAPARLATHCR